MFVPFSMASQESASSTFPWSPLPFVCMPPPTVFSLPTSQASSLWGGLSQAAGAQLELSTLKHRILKTGNLYGFSQWPRGGVGGINAPASLSYLFSCPWTRPILRCGLHLLQWAPAGESQAPLHGTSLASFLHRVPGKCIITSLGFLPYTAHFHSPLHVFPETHPNKSLLYKFLC